LPVCAYTRCKKVEHRFAASRGLIDTAIRFILSARKTLSADSDDVGSDTPFYSPPQTKPSRSRDAIKQHRHATLLRIALVATNALAISEASFAKALRPSRRLRAPIRLRIARIPAASRLIRRRALHALSAVTHARIRKMRAVPVINARRALVARVAQRRRRLCAAFVLEAFDAFVGVRVAHGCGAVAGIRFFLSAFDAGARRRVANGGVVVTMRAAGALDARIRRHVTDGPRAFALASTRLGAACTAMPRVAALTAPAAFAATRTLTATCTRTTRLPGDASAACPTAAAGCTAGAPASACAAFACIAGMGPC
jgi:hypothetical protein